uniref:Integrase catalytic domain-containing protein n=1 Tax=Hordeum vulgare subsp. vulgare TaxID=112509 RepID=A0A8I6YEV4_HORVV
MLKGIIFLRLGVSRYLMTNDGSHFIYGVFCKLLAKYDVNHRITLPHQPESSGQVDLSNREIKSILQKIVNRSRKDWSKKFNDASWAYRTAYKNPMGMSLIKWSMGNHDIYLLS